MKRCCVYVESKVADKTDCAGCGKEIPTGQPAFLKIFGYGKFLSDRPSVFEVFCIECRNNPKMLAAGERGQSAKELRGNIRSLHSQ